MTYFISEEEAVAIIDERMNEIVAKMASGSNANASQLDAANSGDDAGKPCNGSCDAPGTGDSSCCNCCRCA